MNASQFEKGCIPWNKGLKTGLSFWRGKKRPIETCRKISEGHKGQMAWNKGKKLKPLSEEHRRKISISSIGKPSLKKENHPSWKGGRYTNNGYTYIYKQNRNIKKKYTGEHRFVMEQHLGRELLSEEIVHHINEDRADNRIENLQVMSASEHCSHHKNKEKYNLCLIK